MSSGLGGIAFGRGGAIGTNLHVIDGSGRLLRFDANGNASTLGTGFGGSLDMIAGPDYAYYVGEWYNGRILRITPVQTPSAVGGVLVNDNDPDGDALSASLVEPTTAWQAEPGAERRIHLHPASRVPRGTE